MHELGVDDLRMLLAAFLEERAGLVGVKRFDGRPVTIGSAANARWARSPRTVEDDHKAWSSASAVDGTEELHDQQGAPRTIPVRKIPLFGQEGDPRLLLVVGRGLEEQELYETRRLWEAVEQSPVIVMITDADRRIEYVNPMFERTYGYTFEEVRGQDPRLLGRGDTPTEVMASLSAALRAGEAWSGTVRNRTKLGALVVEEVTVSPLRDSSGQISHFLAIKNDVTRKVELETQLLHSQKLETVGRMAGAIAHDLNNLLTVIVGSMATLHEDLPEGDPGRADIELALSAAERASNLTSRLLAFSRRTVQRAEPIDVEAFVREVEPMLRRAVDHITTLEVTVSPSPGWVRFDPDQLLQVLLNLIVNARDASPEGGTIRLIVGARDAGVSITVRDDGIGMSAETQAKLFEPFFTTKAAGVGTGLGLSIVAAIVASARGTIQVESELGRGSTFTILLPSCDPAEAALKRPSASPTTGAHGRILLVEDDPDVGRGVERTLRRAGYDVEKVSNAAEGSQRLGSAKFDLVLTDVILGGATGLSVVADADTRNVPVGVMSGCLPEDLSLPHELPFLPKPFTPLQLRRFVEEILGATRATRG